MEAEVSAGDGGDVGEQSLVASHLSRVIDLSRDSVYKIGHRLGLILVST